MKGHQVKYLTLILFGDDDQYYKLPSAFLFMSLLSDISKVA